MELFETIAFRKSTRHYTSQKVSDADIEQVLKAACASPVANGEFQRIHLTVVQDAALLDRLAKTTAKAFGADDFDPFYGASTLIVVSIKPRDGEPNIEYADAGCIVENMLLAATALDLCSVYLWGFTHAFGVDPSLVDALQIPAGYKPCSGAAIGYSENPPAKRPLEISFSCNYIK